MVRHHHWSSAWLALVVSIAPAGCRAKADAPATQAASFGSPAAERTDDRALAAPQGTAAGLWDVSALVDQVRPAVVSITTKQELSVPMSGLDFFFGVPGGRQRLERIGMGSGFIIDPSGYVVTNEHVVHGADAVRVKLVDEREFDAKVVGRDAQLDLALLRLNGASNLPAAKFGSSAALKVGEPAIAVGNPFGLGNTVTAGIVSAKERALGLGPYDDFIQTDASINPGNSGGPLFNGRGEVVGINTAIRAGASGIGFAIPIDMLKEVLPQLREKGHVERGKLGLVFQQVTPDLAKALHLDAPRGALVADVEPGGPADQAGIKPGDVIVAVGGVPIRRADELPRLVASHPPGTKLDVTVLREGKRMDLSTTLAPMKESRESEREGAKGGAQPKGQPTGKLGIRVENAPGQGVRVVDIAPGANVGDLEEGDVILSLDGKPTRNADELRAAVAQEKPGAVAIARIRRGDMTRFAAVPIPEK